MSNEELERIVREYVDKSLHMSLATCVNNHPWVSEVHFVYDDKLNLYFRSRQDRRHSREIAANPHVAGNIVEQHNLGEYPHAVYFEGSAGVVDDIAEIERVAPLFIERQGCNESIIDDAQHDEGHRFYKVTINNWAAFGKFGRDYGDKYVLEWSEESL